MITKRLKHTVGAAKIGLLRFPRDVRLISFTIPAGADAAE
jgi:hypothetical protein